jgi:hypothetical protein
VILPFSAAAVQAMASRPGGRISAPVWPKTMTLSKLSLMKDLLAGKKAIQLMAAVVLFGFIRAAAIRLSIAAKFAVSGGMLRTCADSASRRTLPL